MEKEELHLYLIVTYKLHSISLSLSHYMTNLVQGTKREYKKTKENTTTK